MRAGELETATVEVRGGPDRPVAVHGWATVPLELLCGAAPWRTFRWYRGQRHYSGSYWSATNRDLVIYESRLELTRLLYADFDPSVTGIVAQPFLLTVSVAGVLRRHVPDFLLAGPSGLTVVDVKPARKLRDAAVAATLAWTAQVMALRSVRYEVWSEPPEVECANIRFLAGYRRGWLFDTRLLAALRVSELDGVTLSQAAGQVAGGWPRPLARAAVLHLLWSRFLTFDLNQRLTGTTTLRRPS